MNTVPAHTEMVACFLDGEAYRARVARIQALMEQALLARARLATAVRLRFRRDADIETRLKDLVTLEQECCPFLVFTIETLLDELVLTISGPESAAALLDKERLQNKIENSNKFSRAIAFGNNQVFLYGDKVEQEMAEGCRRLIKNAIVCWNYLYLTQQIAEADSVERRQELLTAVQQGSVVSWRHVNVHGEYDFSDEKLQDSVGLRLPVPLGLLLPHSEDGAELPSSGC